jgi:DNA-binding LytR/AlgR family response regulator
LPGNEVRKVCAKNIKYIKSTQNYLEYHLTIDNKKEILHIRDKLDNAEAKMNIYDFFRIHRRFLINLSYITETDYSNGIIFLGDEEISLSRNNKESFIEKYKLYLRSLR